jgi:hypothetical protein
MQEHAYPASNEPLIFSRIMVGILDDDVIEVQILYRLYHAGIPIKALDRDKVVQRAAARGSAPLRSARATRIARAASASRVARGHCWAGRVRHPKNVPPITPSRRMGSCFQQGGRSAIPCARATCQFVSFLKLQRRINSAVRIFAGIPVSFRRAHQTRP